MCTFHVKAYLEKIIRARGGEKEDYGFSFDFWWAFKSVEVSKH